MHMNLNRLRHYCMLLLTLLLLGGCSNDSEDVVKKVPTLTEKNMRQFVSIASQDYDYIVDKLEIAYNKHKSGNDIAGFIGFRNTQWTWEYIELKQHYAAVLDKNRKFVARHSLQPVFNEYEGILLIGLDLKHALTDGNSRRERRAFESIKRGRVEMAKMLLRVNKSST